MPDEDEECRICRGGAEIAPLLHPCKCAGSIRYVHEECIKLWLQRTRAKTCELCHHPFKFSPVYAPDTPSRLPTTIFLLGFLRIIGKQILLLLRLGLVIFLWVICLPVGTSWMCRLFFLRSFQGIFFLKDRLQTSALVGDWMQGLLLSILVVGVFLAVSALRDYLVRVDLNQAAVMPVQGPPEELRNEAAEAPQQVPVAPPERREDDLERPAIDEAVPAPQEQAEGEAVNGNGAIVPDEGRIAEWEQGLDGRQDAMDAGLGQDEVPLEEFLGLRGPIRHMVENAVTALVSNGLFIGLLTFVPFSVGRLVLFLLVQLSVLLRKGGAEGKVPNYSDGVTLLAGYACIILLTLELVVLSLLAGKRLQWGILALESPLMRYLLSIVRYAFLLSKVGVLLGVELVVFPLCCGWLVDVSALPLLASSWQDRVALAVAHPIAVQVLHWVLGVLFMLHLSVIVAVVREVLRPEVLWFLRNPADPEEHPFRDLIDEPLVKHARRLVLSLLLYAGLTLLLVHAPVLLLAAAAPSLIPLRTRGRLGLHDPVTDVPPALLLVHLTLPLVMDHLPPRQSFKVGVEVWLRAVAGLLGLDRRILPTPPGSPSPHPLLAPPPPPLALPMELPAAAAAPIMEAAAPDAQHVTANGTGEEMALPCPEQAAVGAVETPLGGLTALREGGGHGEGNAAAGESSDRGEKDGEPSNRLAEGLNVVSPVQLSDVSPTREAEDISEASAIQEPRQPLLAAAAQAADAAAGTEPPRAEEEMGGGEGGGVSSGGGRGPGRVWVRVWALLMAGAAACVFVVTLTLVVPLLLGRCTLACLGCLLCTGTGIAAGQDRPLDLYAFALGFLLCAAGLEAAVGAWQRLPSRHVSTVAALANKCYHMAAALFARGAAARQGLGREVWREVQRAEAACCMALAAVLVPTGLGLLVDASFGFLNRVSPLQSPSLFPLLPLHWLVGVAVIKMLLRVQPDRLPLRPGHDPLYTLRVMAWDAVCRPRGDDWGEEVSVLRGSRRALAVVGGTVCVPYAVMIGVLPALGLDIEVCWTLWRGVYPMTVGNVIIIAGGWRAMGSLGRMHDAIRDSLYLVGRRLHNLE